MCSPSVIVCRTGFDLVNFSDLQEVGDLYLASREAEFTGKGGCDNMRPRRCIATQSSNFLGPSYRRRKKAR